MARVNKDGQIETYHIHTDLMEPVTLEDIVQWEGAIQVFGIWREAEKALLEVTLEMAQGKRPTVDLARLIRNAAGP